MDKLFNAAKMSFASEFMFYLKAHFFHWNIEGADFLQYHDLFGKIYEEVQGSIDEFAEKIRALGTYTPGSFERFSVLSKIEDETEILDKDSMLRELYADNEKIIQLLKMTFKISDAADEQGFCDFIAGRIDAHQKHQWMLRASIK